MAYPDWNHALEKYDCTCEHSDQFKRKHTMTDLLSRFYAVIYDKTGTPLDELSLDKSFDDLKYDSLDIVTLIMSMEDEFDINIDDDRFITVITMQNLYDLVSEKLSEQAKQAPN